MNYKNLFFACLCLLLIVSATAIIINHKKSKEIIQLKGSIGDFEDEIVEYKQTIDEIEQENEDLEEKLSKVQHFDKNVTVENAYPTSAEAYTGGVITKRIDGDFEGWDGETIFKMTDGSIWQQSSYDYHYHYLYSPSVTIYSKNSRTFMKVDGVDKEIAVKKIK